MLLSNESTLIPFEIQKEILNYIPKEKLANLGVVSKQWQSVVEKKYFLNQDFGHYKNEKTKKINFCKCELAKCQKKNWILKAKMVGAFALGLLGIGIWLGGWIGLGIFCSTILVPTLATAPPNILAVIKFIGLPIAFGAIIFPPAFGQLFMHFSNDLMNIIDREIQLNNQQLKNFSRS